MKNKHPNPTRVMQKAKRVWLVLMVLFLLPVSSWAQFIGTETDSSLVVEEVRKGTVIEYSLQDDAKPGEEFRWEVTGGRIISYGAVGEGTIDDPSIIEFTPDMHTVEIQWQDDDSTSNNLTGSLRVQKITVNQCASTIVKQNTDQWSIPTASINEDYTGFTICSGETVGGYIVVDLTGAADFTFSYSIKSNGLKDETGKAINTEFREITTSSDTVHIALPALLVNPSKAASKYYTIELMAMHDDFQGEGEILSDRKEFTITVYPSVEIESIKSTKLNRR